MDAQMRADAPALSNGDGLAPVGAGARVRAIDAARGFALLGIFAVNVQSFGDASGAFLASTPGAEESMLGRGLFYFVRVFCEGKFYPLFSMLFGMGLVLQMGRARPGKFGVMYARRLVVLLLIGLIHATLIWAGDILFVYAIAGFGLLLASRLSGRVLLGIGAGLVLMVGCVCGATFGGMWSLSERAIEAEVSRAAEASGVRADEAMDLGGKGLGGEGLDEADVMETRAEHGRAFAELVSGLQDGSISQWSSDRRWIALERQAFHDGPWHDAFWFNLMTWGTSLIAGAFSYAWHVLGLFFVGAGLMKLGVFRPERESGARWRLVLLVVGVVVGLPLAAAAVAMPAVAPGMVGYIGGTVLQYLSGPLVALLYVSVIWQVAEWGERNGAAGAVVGMLARVGRMALTNYLLHSVVFTGIFYWWGLGLFGELSRAQRLALVPVVYGGLCVTSWLWLRWCRMGPLEWVWRSLTYWRVQRLWGASDEGAR